MWRSSKLAVIWILKFRKTFRSHFEEWHNSLDFYFCQLVGNICTFSHSQNQLPKQAELYKQQQYTHWHTIPKILHIIWKEFFTQTKNFNNSMKKSVNFLYFEITFLLMFFFSSFAKLATYFIIQKKMFFAQIWCIKKKLESIERFVITTNKGK